MIDPSVILEIFQWGGSIAGVVGSWWVGNQQAKERGVGFIWFILSNVFLIAVFTMMKSWPLLGMQLVFLATSIRGLLSSLKEQSEVY